MTSLILLSINSGKRSELYMWKRVVLLFYESKR